MLLNQVIAIVNGKKTKANTELGELYKVVQKTDLFNGLTRTYKPLDEDGETMPSEKKVTQLTVDNAIFKLKEIMSDYLNLVYTQDVANCSALADVVVDDKVILSQVPVTHLLFLEKQLTDLRTFVSHLPTLDPTDEWEFDANAQLNKSKPTVTNRNKKVLKNHLKAPPTDKHPAQVDTYSEDVKIGEWTAIKFSGAISAVEKNKMINRVDDLRDAVKAAREKANSMTVEPKKVAKEIFDFVFAK